MHTITVVIPFFQREHGILTRALNSIASQHIPGGWLVEVIVVDDASPCPAHGEVRELNFSEPLRLKVVRQENGGVAAARNRGLEEADQAAAVVAFLDSDDIWPANHLAQAIGALDSGFDFYFTDNCRDGHHESHCRSPYFPRMAALLATSPQKSGLLEIPKDRMVGLTLGEIPCQASTVVYNRGINKALRFDGGLAYGEDVLFFTSLVASANRVCFDLDSVVVCGEGVNVYFSNLGWDSEKFLSIKVDSLATHRRIAKLNLSPTNKQWNSDRITQFRAELAFHTMRALVKHPVRLLKAIARFIRLDPGSAIVLPIDMIRLVLGHGIRDKTEERRA